RRVVEPAAERAAATQRVAVVPDEGVRDDVNALEAAQVVVQFLEAHLAGAQVALVALQLRQAQEVPLPVAVQPGADRPQDAVLVLEFRLVVELLENGAALLEQDRPALAE